MTLSRNKLIGIGGILILAVLGLRSCGNNAPVTPAVAQAPVVQQQAPVQVQEQPQVVYQEQVPQYDQQQPNVVVVQQPPVYNNGGGYHSGGITTGHLAAGALGYFAGKNSASRPRTIIRERTIVRPRTIYRAPRSYYGSRSRSIFRRRR